MTKKMSMGMGLLFVFIFVFIATLTMVSNAHACIDPGPDHCCNYPQNIHGHWEDDPGGFTYCSPIPDGTCCDHYVE